MSKLHRRHFLVDSATVAGSAVVTGLAAGAAQAKPKAKQQGKPAQASGEENSFASHWATTNDRIWIGPEFWSNPLQDWQVRNGRLECVNAALERNVQLLTYDLKPESGTLNMRVQIGRVDGNLNAGRGSCGFRIGVQGPLEEYRNSLIFGKGLSAGFVAGAGLFIGDELPEVTDKEKSLLKGKSIQLDLTVTPDENKQTSSIQLTATDPATGEQLARVVKSGVPADQLIGNVALVANYATDQRPVKAKANNSGAGKFWFADWQASGSKLAAHPDRAYGPILFTHYTLSEGVLAMTAQMPPLGEADSQQVELYLQKDPSQPEYDLAGQATIDPDARTATFRIKDWDATKEVPYLISYGSSPREHVLLPTHKDIGKGNDNDRHAAKAESQLAHSDTYAGVIRADPVDQPVITLADISCNTHAAFPNHVYVDNVAKLNPDFIAFVGDQFYEGSGGYGVVREPVDRAIVDYLRKWYMHGWTWRELTKDRPSISLPDDHDVYQGNIWGEDGAPQTISQEAGGYKMDARWVNVVHRTQTSHHPAPYDPTPIKQDISVYYGPLTYGKISFAVLADRMFKSAPEGNVPPTGSRPDHVIDPNFDPKTADVPGLQLLGERQMKFLAEWVPDWRGAEMKAILSQTTFTAMATTHGRDREVLRADYDANGWPQTARDEALRLIRKCFAVHVAGDQHLPAVVHYGIDEYGDAPVAFAGPAINVGYPRWWEPKAVGQNRKPGAPELTGDFLDHFGNKMTVMAYLNGEAKPRSTPREQMQDRASGLGIVRFDKPRREITLECWSYLADPSEENSQLPLWPVKIKSRDNYGREPVAYLPTLKIEGVAQPVIEVWDDGQQELIYTLRLAEPMFQPHVFAEGKYTVVAHEPETDKRKKLTGLAALAENSETLTVSL